MDDEDAEETHFLNYPKEILKTLSGRGFAEDDQLEEYFLNQQIKAKKKNIISEEEKQQLEKIGMYAEDLETVDNDSEDEGIEDYKDGGYHPVFIGECLIGRYIVLQKLGWGHFSTVWLCKDVKFDTYVAIKIQKSASHYLEAAFDEVEILQKAVKHSQSQAWFEDIKRLDQGNKSSYSREDCYTVQLLNAFIYQGPYGKHFCMVFEVLGVNLLEIIKRYKYKGIPIDLCRKMSRQILMGLHYLHKHCGIIHTDLKPENVLLCLDKEDLENIIKHKQLNKNDEADKRLKELRAKIIPSSITEVEKENNSNTEESTKIETTQNISVMNGSQKTLNFSKKDKTDKIIEVNKTGMSELVKNGNCKIIEKKATNLNSEVNSSINNDSAMQSHMSTEDVCDLLILNNEDLERELNILIIEEKAETKDHKKKLKKRLKRKMMRHIKRWSKMSEMDQQKYNLLKESLFKHREKLSFHIIEEKEVEVDSSTKKTEDNKFNENVFDNAVGLKKGFKLKIADLGNGCWTHYHFQPEIQTRQYRGPEVILGINYNETADLWSFACMLFEMLTGDFLFDPKKSNEFKKNDDHLAQMIELLNEFPRDWNTIGTNSKRYFDKDGKLKKIKSLRFWGLKDILMMRYKMAEKEAIALEDFLMPMLKVLPQERATAEQMINHYWLDMQGNDFKNKDFSLNHQNDEERFNKIINENDYFAEVGDDFFENDDDDDDDDQSNFVIKGI